MLLPRRLLATSMDLLNTKFTRYLRMGNSIITACGGGKRTRTADICRARTALYQLSYTPIAITLFDGGLY